MLGEGPPWRSCIGGLLGCSEPESEEAAWRAAKPLGSARLSRPPVCRMATLGREVASSGVEDGPPGADPGSPNGWARLAVARRGHHVGRCSRVCRGPLVSLHRCHRVRSGTLGPRDPAAPSSGGGCWGVFRRGCGGGSVVALSYTAGRKQGKAASATSSLRTTPSRRERTY